MKCEANNEKKAKNPILKKIPLKFLFILVSFFKCSILKINYFMFS